MRPKSIKITRQIRKQRIEFKSCICSLVIIRLDKGEIYRSLYFYHFISMPCSAPYLAQRDIQMRQPKNAAFSTPTERSLARSDPPILFLFHRSLLPSLLTHLPKPKLGSISTLLTSLRPAFSEFTGPFSEFLERGTFGGAR